MLMTLLKPIRPRRFIRETFVIDVRVEVSLVAEIESAVGTELILDFDVHFSCLFVGLFRVDGLLFFLGEGD